MAWSLKGSYVETCSCELMCPCNLSFDHGATYDFCRVTLAFHIREGEIDGTDVAGSRSCVIIDTPEGDDRRELAARACSSTSGRRDEQADKLVEVFGGQLGGPMAGLAPLVGEVLGVERARDRADRRRPASQRARRRRDRLRDRGHRARSASRPASRSGSPACSTRSAPISRWPRRRARGSTRSASSTRARRGSRRPSSPGPPEP